LAGLTVYVVWRQAGVFCPQLDHRYFWRWALLSTAVRTPLLSTLAVRCSIPMNGALYSAGPLTEWLNSAQMYHFPFPLWFEYYGLRTMLIPLGLGAIALIWRAQRRGNTEHLRGLRLLSPQALQRQINGSWLTRSWKQVIREQPGMRLGAVTIPRKMECQHFLFSGMQGSGKSVQIRHMLYQVQERKEPAIVSDPDAEYVQEFYNEARGDVILNPLDARCPFWSPWLELRQDYYLADAAAMAASIVRGSEGTQTENYFRNNARSLICGMFQVIPVEERENPTCLSIFLAQSREKIRDKLEGTTAAGAIDPGAHDSGGGQAIVTTANTAVEGFAHLPRRNQTTRVWSARQWAENRRGWVFLSAIADARAAIESLQGVWFDCLIRGLMSQEIGGPRVWIFADELPVLGYQPQIKELAARGRKRGHALVIGVQSIAQLRQIYGRDGAINLIGLPAIKLILRVDDTEMALWASDLLDTREVERLTMTQLAGLSTYREGINLQPQRTTEHIVMTSEIKLLPERQGYLCIAGHDRTTISIPARYLDPHHPDFIPRNTATAQGGNKDAQTRRGWAGR